MPRASRTQKPVYINNDVFGATFRRDHEGDYHCTEAEVRAMIRDAEEESPDQRVLDRKLDFNRETVKAYRTRYNIRHEGSAWTELSDEDFLVQIGAADDEDGLHPTAAGLLMFGTERRITKVFPDRIEKAIYAEKSVELCCAVGVSDETRINYPKAIIVLKKDFEKSEETKQRIFDICKDSLPDYMVPDEIEFRDELPRTARGKVDFRVLEQEMQK